MDDNLLGLRGSTLWGFLRSARIEAPWLQLWTVDLSAGAAFENMHMSCELVELSLKETEAASRVNEWHVPRLERKGVGISGSPRVCMDGFGMITGGLGGLGLLAAEILLE